MAGTWALGLYSHLAPSSLHQNAHSASPKGRFLHSNLHTPSLKLELGSRPSLGNCTLATA